MHTFKLSLLLSVLAGFTLASDKCPDGSDPQIVFGKSIKVCCPGIINNDDPPSYSFYCCVGGSYPSCFPFCSTSYVESCKTKVPLTASDYTSIVYSTAPAASAEATSASTGTTATATANPTPVSAVSSRRTTLLTSAVSTGGSPGSTAEPMVAAGAALAFLGANMRG